jgi:hypothetical protein
MDGPRDERFEPKELELDEFMRLLPHLDAADLMAISAAYQEGDAEARDAARAVASRVATSRDQIAELNRLQSSIIQWAGSDISRTSAFTMESLQTNPMLGDIRMQAIPPLLDAATALLLRSGLSQDHREILLEPVSAAIG